MGNSPPVKEGLSAAGRDGLPAVGRHKKACPFCRLGWSSHHTLVSLVVRIQHTKHTKTRTHTANYFTSYAPNGIPHAHSRISL